jgi:ATP-dependent helicase HrpB
MRLPFPPSGLPVEGILGQLSAALADAGCAVLQAEPGAGKTTLVPPALYGQPWLAGQKILVLQPRRIAARATAERMAELLGEPVGRTVGYRIALESRVSAATRVEVLTEGILARLFADQPDLPGVGLVVFDEFHERSQHADLALALALDSRENLRPDLRVLVMSATIDTAALAGLLGGAKPAPVIDCPGRSHPVTVEWRPPEAQANGRSVDFWNDSRAFLDLVAERCAEAEAGTGGDILVFLPGQGEIRRVAESLAGRFAGRRDAPELLQLHGGLATGVQGDILRPSGRRRLILATNVAETSLTIPGIDLVIDSGLVRVNRFDTRLGMDRLLTERVSQASARQRQGRAGRTAAGRCWKLWPQDERLDPWLPPEIERADLADFCLAAVAWGTPEPGKLRLLSPPAPALWRQALDLLAGLGALETGSGGGDALRLPRLSPEGRALAALGTHPRLSRMVHRASDKRLAWASAILLGERDILPDAASADFRLRLEALLGDGGGRRGGEANQALLQRCRQALAAKTGGRPGTDGAPLPAVPSCPSGHGQEIGRLLALAWPDRVGQLESVSPDRRGRLVARYLLTSGRQALLSGADAEHAPRFLVAPDADAGDEATVIRLFVPVEAPREASLAEVFPELIHETLSVAWDNWRPRVSRRRLVGSLTVEEKPLPASQADRCTLLASLHAEILRGADSRGPATAIAALPWTPTQREVLARLRWAARRRPADWPDCSDTTLAAGLADWLLPHAVTSGGPALGGEIMGQALDGLVGWSVRQRLDQEVPSHWQVPSGSRRPLEYPDAWTGDPGAAPILAVRIQEVFGMERQPVVLGVPLLLHLLSPAQRPLQVTADLEGFWRRTYPEIRKEMRGRYPRHYWPDNPLEAEPTSRAKPRGT